MKIRAGYNNFCGGTRMDFELTKSQKDILKAAKEFAKGEFDKELALELDRF
jgi:hypothetical protein